MRPLRLLLLLSLAPLCSSPAAAQFIFYDYDNSRLSTANNLFSAGSITSSAESVGTEVYAWGWLYNTGAGIGLFNENLKTHFYASGGVWNMTSEVTGAMRLALRTAHSSTMLGNVYSDGSSFGLLNDYNNWALYSTGGNTVVNFPGSIQIGANGGIIDTNAPWGSIALDTAKGGYYGMLFGSGAANYNLRFDASGNGGYYQESGVGWRDQYTKDTRTWDINASVYANNVYSEGYQALNKVVFILYCRGGNDYCDPPPCPASTNDIGLNYADGVSGRPYMLSNINDTSWVYMKFRVCCAGTD